MTEPEGDALYSPVPSYPTTQPPPPPGWDPAAPAWTSPGGATPPPPAAGYPYAAGQPPAPQLPSGYRPGGPATPPTTSAAPSAAPAADPRKRRTRLVVGLVTGLVLLAGACVGIGTAVSRAREEFSDDRNRVTARAPYSWDGYSDPDAVSGPPTADEQAEGYEYEDLGLSSFLGDYSVLFYIDDGAPIDPVEAIQARSVAEECRIWTCESQGSAALVTVGGHPGVEQIVTVSGGGSGRVEVVTTVRTPTMVVRVLASRDWDSGDPPDPKRLVDVVHSTTFAR